MASFFDKFRIKTAVEGRSQFSFDEQHITTSDFFQLQPVYVRHLVPNSSIDVDAMCFSRLEPLAVPTFGRASVHLRAFFVPYSYVWRGWNDFITDAVHSASDMSQPGILGSVPVVSNTEIVNAFFRSVGTEYGGDSKVDSPFSVLQEGTSSADFEVGYTDGHADSYVRQRFMFTSRGRLAYKVLQSLGYQIFPTIISGTPPTYYNALPLLALARIYLDWYQASGYVGLDGDLKHLELLLNEDSGNQLNLTYTDVRIILSRCVSCNFASDYFTSAFDNPTGPNIGTYSNVTVPDVTLPYVSDTNKSQVSTVNYSNYDSHGTPTVSRGDNYGIPTRISQYVLDSLKRVTQFFKRNQLAGSRAADRFFARFGVTLSSAEQRRARYLGSVEIPLQIGDVFSTADTDGSSLGEFAGRGFAHGNQTFKCSSSEDYGLFIVMSSIIPSTGYYQGLDRSVLMTSRFDFWSPEFDGLGVQAISSAELFAGNTSYADGVRPVSDANSVVPHIFGFTPRYSHYKVSRDRLTGDFNVRSFSLGKSSWHLMRVFDPINTDLQDLVHSPAFLSGLNSNPFGVAVSEFDRIFTNSDTTVDHFNMFYQFNSKLVSPMKPLYDVFEFDDAKGKEVDIKVNGSSFN